MDDAIDSRFIEIYGEFPGPLNEDQQHNLRAFEYVSKYTAWRDQQEKIDKLQAKLDEFGKSSSDLKSRFMGEYYLEIEQYDEDGNDMDCCRKYLPWTLVKEIYKEMSQYVKDRKDEDYRP